MSFEEKIPVLEPGEILYEGEKLIYETPHASHVVFFPRRYDYLIKMMDGKNSIQEIMASLYGSRTSITFKDLFECIGALVDANIICNIEKSEISNEDVKRVSDARIPLLSKQWYSQAIKAKTTIKRPHFLIFSTLALAIVFLGIFSFIQFLDLKYLNQFLKIDDSYFKGIIYFFVCNSVILSSKTLMKYLLVLMATGRAYNLRFQINFFSVSLRVDDSSIFTLPQKWLGFLYGMANLCGYFFLVFVYSMVFTDVVMTEQLYVMALLYTLVDLDPFRSSDTNKMLRLFFEEENMDHLLPYLKKKALLAVRFKISNRKKETLYIVYSTLAVAWLVVSVEVAFSILDRVLPNLVAAVLMGSILDQISAAVIGLSLSIIGLYLAFDMLNLFFSGLIRPFLKSAKLIDVRSSRLVDFSSDQVLEIIRSTALFNELDHGFLDRFLETGAFFRFHDREPILYQGDEGTSMYVIVEGAAKVVHHQESGLERTIAHLETGAIFGEQALISGVLRSADVIASGPTTVFQITKERFELIRQKFSDSGKLLHRIELNQFLCSSEVFQDIPKEIASLFTKEGSYVESEQGDFVFMQGELSKDFYLILRGEAEVLIGNELVATIEQGGFFGEMALFRNAPRNASIRMKSKGTLFRLSKESFWKIVSQNIQLAMYLETVAELRSLEDQQEAS